MLKEKYNTKSLACRFHYAGLTTSHDLCVQRNMVCKMHWNFLFTNYNEHVNTIWHVEMPILSVASDTAHCRHLLVVTLSLSVLSCQLYTGVKVCVKSEIYHGDETDIDRVPRCANQYSSVDTFDPYVSVCQKKPHQYEYHVNILWGWMHIWCSRHNVKEWHVSHCCSRERNLCLPASNTACTQWESIQSTGRKLSLLALFPQYLRIFSDFLVSSWCQATVKEMTLYRCVKESLMVMIHIKVILQVIAHCMLG